MTTKLRAAVVLLCLLLTFAVLEARTLLVPQEYEQIRQAISASQDGDTVLIAPGVYEQTFSLSGHNLVIMGDPADPSRVILDGRRESRVITIVNREERVTLTGLTIRNGSADQGGGLYCANAAYPVVSYCCFIANSAGVAGGAIYCSPETNAGAYVVNCTFYRNDAPRGDAVSAGVDFRFINCLVWDDQDNIQEVRLEREDSQIRYCDIQGGQRSVAGLPMELIVFDFDPLFVNPGNFDLHLQRQSACIDAGDPEQRLDADETICDIGAFTHLIEGPPAPLYAPSVIDFGMVPVGIASVCSVSVRNIGSEPLIIEDVLVDDEGFLYEGETGFIIDPRRRICLPVTFSPDDGGDWEGALDIVYRNYGEGGESIALRGQAMFPPSVCVEPLDFFIEADSAGFSEYVLNLANDGGSNLAYKFTNEYGELPAGSNDNSARYAGGWGPRRTAAGDVLRRFELTMGRTVGLAWDGERMWGASDEGSYLFSIDPETGQMEDSVHIEMRPRGLAYHEGRFYTSFPSTGSTVYIYDDEGRYLDQLSCPVRDICGLAIDDDNHLFLATYQYQQLYVLTLDSLQVLARISIPAAIRHPGFSLTRVDYQPTHEMGPLWLLLGSYDLRMSLAVQCHLDEAWNLTEVQSIRLRDFGHTGIASDGQNLWHGGDQNGREWVMYDNGIPEQTWLALERKQGSLRPWEDTDVIFSIDADLLHGGDYRCVIHVLSNDPHDPDVPVVVRLTVHTYESAADESAARAGDFRLDGAFPNPFNASTTITYSIPRAGVVGLSVFDLQGREVALLGHGLLEAGEHRAIWRPTDLAAGIYCLRLETAAETAVRKVIYLP